MHRSAAAAFSFIVQVEQFNPPVNFNMLQVDIGIPHELWDKPSAEVKIQGMVKWRDC